MTGPATKVIDAGGKALLPGLYDSHVHPLGAAHSEKDHPIPSFESLADVMAYFADRVKAQPKGTWIVARYAFPTRLDESRFPTRAELDAIAPDHMVLHQGGPAGVVNTKALGHSGHHPRHARPARRPDRQGPEDRRADRDDAQRLLGAQGPARRRLRRRRHARTPTGSRRLFRRTTARDRPASPTAGRACRRSGSTASLRDRGELTVRVNATRILSPPFGDRATIVAKLNELAGYDTARRAERPDRASATTGSASARSRSSSTAACSTARPTCASPGASARPTRSPSPTTAACCSSSPTSWRSIAEEAARRGWQMTAHCAGEAGMDELLAAYDDADRAIGIRDRRWLITHANFTSAENLKRCAELGVGADLQPAWLWKDTRTLLKVLGPRRMEWFHPYRKLARRRADDRRRQRPHDPHRPDRVHQPVGPLAGHLGRRDPQDRRGPRRSTPTSGSPALEALRFYTINNARLHFEEHDKGTIEPGKLADLILVDRDPLTCPEDDLRTTRVLWTMVGGRIVHGTP